MMEQLDLFTWAEQRPSAVVIDMLPALCRKAALEVIYKIPPRKGEGQPIPLKRGAA